VYFKHGGLSLTTAAAAFFFFGGPSVAQADLDLLGTGHPPASASQVVDHMCTLPQGQPLDFG
jgi:hypothetical protein